MLAELQAGEVRSVLFEGERATVTLADGRIQQTTTFLRRSATPDRYASLGRLADLRDRGVFTEDEFQREKRRLLR